MLQHRRLQPLLWSMQKGTEHDTNACKVLLDVSNVTLWTRHYTNYCRFERLPTRTAVLVHPIVMLILNKALYFLPDVNKYFSNTAICFCLNNCVTQTVCGKVQDLLVLFKLVQCYIIKQIYSDVQYVLTRCLTDTVTLSIVLKTLDHMIGLYSPSYFVRLRK